MKKMRIIIAVLTFVLAFMFGQSNCFAKNKVNVYMFEGDGCPHCAEAIEWFEGTLAKDSEYTDKYELIKYEVWYNQDNNNLMSDVSDALKANASGVPFIVIGDKYFSGFSATSSPEQIKNAIKEQYENKDYQDVVKAVKDGTFTKKEGKGNSILPIIIVSSIAIVSVLALVFFTKEK